MASVASLDVLPLKEPARGEEVYTLEKLANDEICNQITSDFKGAGLVAESIEYLQNYNCWVRFTDKKKQILDREPQDPDFKLNETYLYHGTSANKNSLCEEGFDVNLASDGCFGRGIYFSDSPKKCVKYARNNVILVARVILGEVKEYADGKKDSMLRREPEKSDPYKGWRYYDSVKGRPRNLTEFVIYRNEHALIEYIVKFSKSETNSPAATPLPQELNTESKSESKSQDEDVHLDPSDIKTELDADKSDSESSDSDNDFDDATEEIYSSSSSDEEEDDVNEQNSEDENNEERPSVKEAWMTQSVIPYFTIPEGELSLEKKKSEYKRVTLEENDSEVDLMLKKTDEDLERAIYLFYAYKQVREEEAKRQAGEFVEETIEDDGSPIFPLMDPAYESEAWNNLDDADKKAMMDKMIVDFLSFTALEETHRHIADNYVTNAKYNLDTAVLNYYKSWF